MVRPRPNNIAPRIGFRLDGQLRSVNGRSRRLWDLLQPGGAGDVGGVCINPPFFNLDVFFPFQAAGPIRLSGSVPRVVPYSGSAIGDRVSARPADAVDGALQRYAAARDRTARTVEIGYVGSRGHDLISARDGNQPPASPSPFNFRPNPAFADITLIESRASSRYNSLQFRLQQRSGIRPLHVVGLHVRASPPTMLRILYERGEIRTSRRTAWIRRRRRAARRSTSATG